jgi:hypothetical protein
MTSTTPSRLAVRFAVVCAVTLVALIAPAAGSAAPSAVVVPHNGDGSAAPAWREVGEGREAVRPVSAQRAVTVIERGPQYSRVSVRKRGVLTMRTRDLFAGSGLIVRAWRSSECVAAGGTMVTCSGPYTDTLKLFDVGAGIAHSTQIRPKPSGWFILDAAAHGGHHYFISGSWGWNYSRVRVPRSDGRRFARITFTDAVVGMLDDEVAHLSGRVYDDSTPEPNDGVANQEIILKAQHPAVADVLVTTDANGYWSADVPANRTYRPELRGEEEPVEENPEMLVIDEGPRLVPINIYAPPFGSATYKLSYVISA